MYRVTYLYNLFYIYLSYLTCDVTFGFVLLAVLFGVRVTGCYCYGCVELRSGSMVGSRVATVPMTNVREVDGM